MRPPSRRCSPTPACARWPTCGGVPFRAGRGSVATRWRDASRNAALADPSLRAYADAQSEPTFARDLEALLALAARAPTVVMCAERDWRHCHRQILADLLVARGWEVFHLAPDAAPEPHRLAETARVEGGTVSYPSLL
ncbi:MAG TPA: DUF488 family protein [Myxococcota bacterium]|nr:DUF488 family protein [Myxococcota bacterium]